MKRRLILISVLALGLMPVLAAGLSLAQGPGPRGDVDIQAAPVGTVASAPLSTSFTYQGRLTDGDSPADGSYDFQFKLYDAESDGDQVGEPDMEYDVDVKNGYFTVKLDFGDVFDGTALWLEIGVRPGDGPSKFTVLSPRQELTATPYALHARDAWSLTGNEIQEGQFLGTTNDQPLVIKTNDEEAMRIDVAGNVTRLTNPRKTLQVKTWGSTRIAVNSGNPGADIGYSLLSGDVEVWQIYADAPDNLHVSDATNIRLSVNRDTGNVGIGTTTPQNKLDVEGAVAIGTDYSGTATAPTDGMIIEGNVGIGTTEPKGKLDLGGIARSYYLTRTIPTALNHYVELGYISGESFSARIAVSKKGGYSTGTKHYLITTNYHTNQGWKKVIPLSDTGVTNGNDFTLDANWNSEYGPLYLRVRLSKYYEATPPWGPFKVSIEVEGNGAFTETSGSGSTSEPIDYSTSSALVQRRGNVGIGTTNPDDNHQLHVQGGNQAIYGVATAGTDASRPFGVVADANTSAAVNTGGGFWTSISTSNLPNIPYVYGGEFQVKDDGNKNARVLTLLMDGEESNDFGLEILVDDPGYAIHSGGTGTVYFRGDVGIGTSNPSSKLTVDGVIESASGGIKFPDGSIQTTAAGPSAAWLLNGNSGTNPATNFLGTTDEVSLTLRVNDTIALRLEPTSGTPNVIGGYSGNWVAEGVVGAAIGGGGKSGLVNRVTADSGAIGGGEANMASSWCATIGGGGGNLASGSTATVGGGNMNTASSFAATVGGGLLNDATNAHTTIGGGAYNTTSGSSSTVSGGSSNTASSDFATVGGGEHISVSGQAATVAGGSWITATADYAAVGGGQNNIASGNYATIGGGEDNMASGYDATVGGGWDNTASGGSATVGGGLKNTASSYNAAVGGGWHNTASGQSATVSGGESNTASGFNATIGGGSSNTSDGYDATVGGGGSNTASGESATVPGGFWNTAQGDYSFAAGRQAKANNQGCFVWGDSTNADVACNTNDAFIVRASGGVTMYTNSNLSTGATLPAGSGSWSSLSDRDAKYNFSSVDGQEVLARLAQVPISTWSYSAQDPAIRHMGPMAQDFYAAFGLGESERYISAIDADGVALAAIQGLYQLVQEKDAQMAAQQHRIDDLEARVAALEQAVGATCSSQTNLPGGWLPFDGLRTLLLGGLLVAVGVVVRRQHPGGGQ
jgi:hypothetical protein